MAEPPAAHVFVADLDSPALEGGDDHHLARVLRLRDGEAVTASDGSGGWRRCRFRPPDGLEPDGDVVMVSRPEPVIVVGFALTKGERPEWTVQKLTEAGVDVAVPLAADRCVVRWDEGRAVRNVDRLRKVAREAAMQARRVWLPEVRDIARPAEFVTRHADGGVPTGGVALAQPGGEAPSLSRPAVMVGPEGGWSESELDLGVPHVGLGATVYRSETAAVAVGILLCALRDGVLSEPR